MASWARKGAGLRWAVKVHRYITHVKRLKEDALDTWLRFSDLFQPLDPYIDFYLFQMPPHPSPIMMRVWRGLEHSPGKQDLALGLPLSFATRAGSAVRMPLMN